MDILKQMVPVLSVTVLATLAACGAFYMAHRWYSQPKARRERLRKMVRDVPSGFETVTRGYGTQERRR